MGCSLKFDAAIPLKQIFTGMSKFHTHVLVRQNCEFPNFPTMSEFHLF